MATLALVLCLAMADPPTVVDLMVCYTPAARTKAGGKEKIEASIELAVAEGNAAYAKSGVFLLVQLVYLDEVVYGEEGITWDYIKLLNPNDAVLDEIHTLRNTVGADCVSLITAKGEHCGTAGVMQSPSPKFESSAFSVTHYSCLPLLTLTHELGHNMGCGHDRPGGQGAYPFSHGYKHPGTNPFATVMAVSSGRIPRFSNPAVTYQGVPTGISHAIDPKNSADNAQTLNLTREIVAAFRNPPDFLSALGGGDGILTDKDGDGIEWAKLCGTQSIGALIESYTWWEDGKLLAAGVDVSVAFPLGTHAVTLVVEAGSESSQDTVIIQVVKNQSPIADAGADQRVIDLEMDGTQEISLDGSESFDPDGTLLTYDWYLGETWLATGLKPKIVLSGYGIHVLTLRVRDNGNEAWNEDSAVHQDTVSITVAYPLKVPSMYPTIQDAVTMAVDGDVVMVEEGVYTGPGNRDILVWTLQRLAIRSVAGPEKTIIDCQGSAAMPHQGFILGSGINQDTVVEGFTVRGAHSGWQMKGGGALRIASWASPTIRNCILIDNQAVFGGGIYIDKYSAPQIWNTRILKNSAAVGGGVYSQEALPQFRNCVIAQNKAGWIGGPSVAKSTAGGMYLSMRMFDVAGIYHCTIADNESSESPAGIEKSSLAGTVEIFNSILWGNASPWFQDPLSVQTNISKKKLFSCDVQLPFGATLPSIFNADPLFVNPAGADYRLSPGSSCVNLGVSSFSTPTDIEGTARYFAPDLGAYEVGGPLSFYDPSALELWAQVGVPYVGAIACHGGKGDSLMWSVTPLPPGLHLESNGSSKAYIQGIPEAAWEGRIEIRVEDQTGATAAQVVPLEVKP